jgi:hypothetical protein
MAQNKGKQNWQRNLLPLPSVMYGSSSFTLLAEESAETELDASGLLKTQSVALSIFPP